MSEKSKAKAAHRLTGDPYQKCLTWLKTNRVKVTAYISLNRHNTCSQSEAAAKCYAYYKKMESIR